MVNPPATLEQAVAEVIQRHMKDQGISENQMALDTYIPRVTLRRRFQINPNKLTIEEMRVIANRLGTTPEALTAEARQQVAA
jgi:ribosomal protein S12 methylthiotransferase accessory factor YcaO